MARSKRRHPDLSSPDFLRERVKSARARVNNPGWQPDSRFVFCGFAKADNRCVLYCAHNRRLPDDIGKWVQSPHGAATVSGKRSLITAGLKTRHYRCYMWMRVFRSACLPMQYVEAGL
jgi:hypothetical protein